MSKELPTVIIFENEVGWSRMLSRMVNDHPSLVLPTLESALAWLDEQELDDEGVVVAAFIVDGNLSDDETSGEDGDLIVEKIRHIRKFDTVPVIGNSGSREVTGADHNLNKNLSDVKSSLPTLINQKRS